MEHFNTINLHKSGSANKQHTYKSINRWMILNMDINVQRSLQEMMQCSSRKKYVWNCINKMESGYAREFHLTSAALWLADSLFKMNWVMQPLLAVLIAYITHSPNLHIRKFICPILTDFCRCFAVKAWGNYPETKFSNSTFHVKQRKLHSCVISIPLPSISNPQERRIPEAYPSHLFAYNTNFL